MLQRLLNLPRSHSFFLFGPRGAGKSTLLEQHFKNFDKNEILKFDLLLFEDEQLFINNPQRLVEFIESNKKIKWVVIDEVQKVPKLLDIVHYLIEKKKINFALSGSSARKLKHGSANLLAGRAFNLQLLPLSYFELKNQIALDEILTFGSFPKIFNLEEKTDKIRFINSYVQTYLKEEIQAEQIVRNISSFRNFIAAAGTFNTEIINFSKIGQVSGVDYKSVSRFFEILVDTLIGFYLEPYNTSVRKRQKLKPKFYFHDIGITRGLQGNISETVQPSTSYYGKLFEHFIILEFQKLNLYLEKNFKLSYLQAQSGAEIDLIVEAPSKKTYLIEIKSSKNIIDEDVRHLNLFKNDFKKSRRIILCQEKLNYTREDGVEVYPWALGLKEIFEID